MKSHRILRMNKANTAVSDFKLYYRDIVIKTIVIWAQTQANRVKGSLEQT